MVWIRGEFIIVDRHWTDEKDEEGNRIYEGIILYEGQGRFNGKTLKLCIPHSKYVNAGKALDDKVKKANHGLPQVQNDYSIKDLEELMKTAGKRYSARLMRRMPR